MSVIGLPDAGKSAALAAEIGNEEPIEPSTLAPIRNCRLFISISLLLLVGAARYQKE
jgi:hypothetical protein